MLVAALAARVFYQNPPHCLRSCGKEMAAAVPFASAIGAYEAEVGLMYQGRCLQRLPWLLLSQLGGSEFSQFVIDQRQKLLSGSRIALLDLRQNAGDVGHGQQFSRAE